MLKKILLIILFSSNVFCSDNTWAVIGFGPAGVIVTSLLLEIGVPAKNICVIDPSFSMGDLSNYPNIPANTKNKLWIDFLSSFKVFKEIHHPSIDKIFNSYEPEKEYPLSTIIEPLNIISDYLKSKVSYIKDKINNLYFYDNNWRLGFSNGEVMASHVVLAIGSRPKELNLNVSADKNINLIDALDANRLSSFVSSDDVVAVFGSSHSAVLILKNLQELGVKKVINFYKHPFIYTQDMGGWYLNLSSGLKGVAADWAKNVLESNPPVNLYRLLSTDENIKMHLPECTKIVHAVGFERNHINIAGQDLSYDDTTGVIAPRLFGIGIAFPEKYIDPLGNVEHRIGINSFTEYAFKVVPEWAKAKKNQELMSRVKLLEEFISIELL